MACETELGRVIDPCTSVNQPSIVIALLYSLCIHHDTVEHFNYNQPHLAGLGLVEMFNRIADTCIHVTQYTDKRFVVRKFIYPALHKPHLSLDFSDPVSYTHLTLPTILRV